MSKYTAEYFYNFFSRIPESRWTIGVFKEKGTNSCCAMGHLDWDGSLPISSHALAEALINVLMTVGHPVSINDATNEYFLGLGETPKERILNALVLAASGVINET